jgi:DNA-directed RNA polymerase specialized sigma24 family protein
VIQAVRLAVSELDEIDCEIITLRTFEGLAYKEITLLTGLSSEAARKRYGRALLRLHDRLATLLSDIQS